MGSGLQSSFNLAEVYHVLSLAYLKLPDEEVISQVNTYLGISSNCDITELKSDYTRLFIGPYKLLSPPWESVYRSRLKLVCQEPLLEVKKYIWKQGWY